MFRNPLKRHIKYTVNRDRVLGLGSVWIDQVFDRHENLPQDLILKNLQDPSNLQILEKIQAHLPFPSPFLGGSSVHISALLGQLGIKSFYLGKVGLDSWSKWIYAYLRKVGVRPVFEFDDFTNRRFLLKQSGQVLSFKSPRWFYEPKDLKRLHFRKSRIVHVDSSVLAHPDNLERLLKVSRAEGAKIFFNVDHWDSYTQNQQQVLRLIQESAVIFAQAQTLMPLLQLARFYKDPYAIFLFHAVHGVEIIHASTHIHFPLNPINDNPNVHHGWMAGFIASCIKGHLFESKIKAASLAAGCVDYNGFSQQAIDFLKQHADL